MTQLLASVLSAEEAELACNLGADIIDFKDPRAGALGALSPGLIRDAVRRIAGRRPVSATAGDLPMHADIVVPAVQQIAATGVDFVKVGLFPGGASGACLTALARQDVRLVLVMFADQDPDFSLIERAAGCGFAGVMLDTADKSGGGLRRHLEAARLQAFVRLGRAAGLLTGLAGSLKLADIPALLSIAPDYLGFRGALTAAGRSSALDPEALAAVRRLIPRRPGHQSSAARTARAAAGAQRAAHSFVSGAPPTRSAKST